ncbi:response regulator [Desulfurivibrio alkaliphilus]|uniref:Response regulator receiver protein n=1 Tax=Desulfurivibrio alkaliphilus (strain DSM 19089 / UNIQEM U267 / AHT2) TaxID=589865 RepID=D6Z6I7_DESAT|nr:response regulator [Desulfurivibrio alkaliphilus]ADH84946.1 response regulator receiver protein [Desulfurivibrio alkaliphilus AHT 2]
MLAQNRDDLFAVLRHLKLLLVEDDELIRDSLALFFANEGCRLEVQASAEDGLQLVRVREFDVVITDFRLPGMSGLEFLRILQEMQPEAQKILLTAYMNEEVLAEAFRLGVHEFIEKPIATEDIEEALARLIRRRSPTRPTLPGGV